MFRREDIVNANKLAAIEKTARISVAERIMGDKYKEVKIRRAGGFWDEWYCPYCHKWVLGVGIEGELGAIKTKCRSCGKTLVWVNCLSVEQI